MKAVICIAAALLSFGCSGWRFYAHDRGLEERLKNVEQQFADLSRAQSSVWAVMQSNLEAAARRESEALRRDAANRRAATIGSLDGLKWSVVKLDADKIRNRASDNLETW